MTAAAAAMSERELQDRIRRMCDSLGLEVMHVEDMRRCWMIGWPDLSIFGKSVLFAELKSETGQLTADQKRVRKVIESAGLQWRLWRPADLLDGTIARELTALSALPIAAFYAADIDIERIHR